MVIPADLAALEKQYTGCWTFSLSELFQWPVMVWKINAAMVFNFFLHYYHLAVLALVAGFTIWILGWRRSRSDLMIITLFWLGSLAIIFGLRGFNEYMYHTAVIIFLIAILARCSSLISVNCRVLKNFCSKFSCGTAILLITIILVFWSWQIVLMKTDAIKYLERGITWLKGNYLFSWSSGFGVPELVEFLKARPNSSIAFIDPQWGNPGTALQVFHNYYPQVRIELIDQNLLNKDFQQ